MWRPRRATAALVVQGNGSIGYRSPAGRSRRAPGRNARASHQNAARSAAASVIAPTGLCARALGAGTGGAKDVESAKSRGVSLIYEADTRRPKLSGQYWAERTSSARVSPIQAHTGQYLVYEGHVDISKYIRLIRWWCTGIGMLLGVTGRRSAGNLARSHNHSPFCQKPAEKTHPTCATCVCRSVRRTALRKCQPSPLPPGRILIRCSRAPLVVCAPQVTLTVPPGSSPGSHIAVGEGESAVKITIPDGLQPGQTFVAAVPSPPPSPPGSGDAETCCGSPCDGTDYVDEKGVNKSSCECVMCVPFCGWVCP